jgi:2-dehydro-3-deoxygalactonokinase
MYIATIDCGTTNTRVYIVDENAKVITRTSQKVGVRDTAISGNNQALKNGIREVFHRALEEAGIKASEIRCILSSGMITSELGLLEVPHLWAPCSMTTLAENLTPFKDDSIFPPSIPFYFIRGVKNHFDPKTVSMKDVGTLDFMRGEEAQVAGLLENPEVKYPCYITVLSSHTKFIAVDEKQTILGSVTTLSGQLYEAILQETFVGKSVRSEDGFDDTNFFNPEIVNNANNEITKSGFLRGLMYVRFLDTLVHTPWYERKLFAESLLAAEDMRALHQTQELTGLVTSNFVLIGKTRRCRIYEHLLKQLKSEPASHISIIDDEAEIDQLSIRGALSLAKKAGII